MTDDRGEKRRLLDGRQMQRIVRRMAGEVIERVGNLDELMLVGIRTRGVPLAERLQREIAAMEGHEVPLAVLDITLYRDDLSTIAPQPVVRRTTFPHPVEGRTLVLCDDVLYTGRTVRAALDALVDYGRPKAVRMAVLVDRGHRELPIHGDFVGREVQTADDDVIKVHFAETDGKDEVLLLHHFHAGRA